MKNDDISNVSPIIKDRYKDWQRNRDFLAGERAVKGGNYLPRLIIHDGDDTAYAKYKERIPFFPASERILQGIMGMVFRKAPTLSAPAGVESVFETITREGYTVEDLSQTVAEEVFTTNFCGLLIDHPTVSDDDEISLLQYEAEFSRPFISLYPAESILDLTPIVYKNRQILGRVVLQDGDDLIREMVLSEGICLVIFHDRIEDKWIARDPIIPMRNGVALTEIPFVHVSTKPKTFKPLKSVMDDVCAHNHELYKAQALRSNLLYFAGNPFIAVKGSEVKELRVSAGAIVAFPDHTSEQPVEIGYVETSGVALSELAGEVQTIKSELSVIGSRIIAPDTKAGVESAEAKSLRDAAQNSVLASQTKTISRGIQRALEWVVWWMGSDAEIGFDLSTDFVPTPMSPQERAQVVSEWMAGLYTHETALTLYKDGEILPDSFDVETEIEKVSTESLAADRPLITDQPSGEQTNGGE